MRKSSTTQPWQSKCMNRTKVSHRVDSNERFSSFETPPRSEVGGQEFSDFETPRTEEKFQFKDRASDKKERSFILSKEKPQQCDYLSTSLQKSHRLSQVPTPRQQQIGQKSLNRDLSSLPYNKKGEDMKENCQLRYNYPNKMQGSLSTIKQDLRESDYSSLTQITIQPLKKMPSEGQWKGSTMSAMDRICIQQQKIQILVLQEENAILREKVVELEVELYRRDQEKIIKKADSYANRLSNLAHEELVITSRQSAKMKLLNQIAILQMRCRQMKEEMDNYKLKQQIKMTKLLEQKTQRVTRKIPESYELKFHEVFLNMIDKLPIEMDKSWSSKKRIAVGWKVVKHLIKKAMKLGIQPPTIVDKDDLH